MNESVPHPAPVGTFLGREVEAAGWTLAEFAAVLGRPVQFVSELVNNRKEITRESAAQIGAALGQTPEFWLRLQDQYLLREQAQSLKSQQELDEVRRRSRLNRLVPVGTLRKRGVLRGRTLDELEAEVRSLLELASIDDEPNFQIAARRSNRDEPTSPTQVAWVACVRRAVRSHRPVANFAGEGLAKLAERLPVILQEPGDFAQLPQLFAEVGVALVYVEALPGAKIDGCAFVLDGVPVIALSGRGKRLDKVLWTLLHETAHVVLGHVSTDVVVETLEESDLEEATEVDADNKAGKWLLPTPLPRVSGRIGVGWVRNAAAASRLAPIVVVGQLQKQGVLDWRTTLARNAPTVEDALAGWG